MGAKRDAAATRQTILTVATEKFIRGGLDGTAVDDIAAAAGCNKQLIYYYFKSKDNLFTEVLKRAYAELREHDESVDFAGRNAYESILELTRQTWNFYRRSPGLIYLLLSENTLRAAHVKQHSAEFLAINKDWRRRTENLLARGREDGSIRADLDAMQLNISIAALIIFYITNGETLSVLYGTDLGAEPQLSARLASILDTVGSWIAPRV